jgi:eukaryotic-like serine/threonine-protein kinase
MFHKLGRHLAIYYFPDEFRESQALMAAKGMDESRAAREIFGADFTEFGTAIGRDWHLPEGLLAAMQPCRGERIAPAGTVNGQIAQVSAFCNEVAEIVGGDATRLDTRLGSLLERYADCVPLTTANLKTAVVKAIDATRAYAAIINVDFDNAPYLGRVERAVNGSSEHTRQAAPRTPGDTLIEEAAALSADDLVETGQRRHLFLTNAIAELTTAILERAPVNDMFTMVLEALYRSMGFSHVLFLMRDPKRRAYATRFGFGPDLELLKARFVYRQEAGEDIFSLAVNKGRNAVIVDTADTRYCDGVPAWCRELTNPLSILVFAVIVNKVCIGLIYADNCSEPLRMSATELKLLNTLVRQLALGVVQR